MLFLLCRKDIAKLEQRAGTLSEAEPCASCGRPVGEAPAEGEASSSLPPYFLFPSGNAFHGTCLAREVLHLAPHSQRQRLQKLIDTSQKVLLVVITLHLPSTYCQLCVHALAVYVSVWL